MTTYLGKSCSFGFEGRMWDLIVSVPDHCLSFYLVWQWKKKSKEVGHEENYVTGQTEAVRIIKINPKKTLHALTSVLNAQTQQRYLGLLLETATEIPWI